MELTKEELRRRKLELDYIARTRDDHRDNTLLQETYQKYQAEAVEHEAQMLTALGGVYLGAGQQGQRYLCRGEDGLLRVVTVRLRGVEL